MKERKSFVLYLDSLDVLELLSDEQAGRLFRVIRAYEKGEELPEVDQLTKVAFSSIRNYLDRDAEKYRAICQRNQENGAKGGRPKNPVGFKETQKTQSVLEKPKETQRNPEKPDNDNVNTNVNVLDPENENDPESERDMYVCVDKPHKQSVKRFTPPTVEQVRDYCRERGNGVDPEKFVNFYESKGWKVGKNPMKDWRASVRTWERDRPGQSTNRIDQKLDALRNFGENL